MLLKPATRLGGHRWATVGLFLTLGLFSAGCQRKENSPLLGTPDPSVNDVELFVRGVDRTQSPSLSVLLQSVGNSTLRMGDLSAGNFSVLQGDLPLIVSHFQKVDPTFSVMLVIDRSGSMNGDFSGVSRKQAANEAATLFLNSLPASASAGLVEFDSSVQVSVPLTSDKTAVADAVNASTFGGGATAAYDAIVAGAGELGKSSGLRLVIVLTDGDDNSSRNSPAAVSEALQSAYTIASAVIIGGDVADTTSMQGIVDDTSGTLSTSLDSTQLTSALNSTLNNPIFQELYLLTFRKRANGTNYRAYVSYGAYTNSVDFEIN